MTGWNCRYARRGRHRRAVATKTMCLQLMQLLPCVLACLSLANYCHLACAASSNGNRQPRTVRPINTASPTRKSRRLPFLSSPKSHKAAQKAYLQHLQSELETSQRQLYVSQNTCATLRKRWEDQRKETLGILASSHSQIAKDSEAVDESSTGVEPEEYQQQQIEIQLLQNQLDAEMQKYEKQVEQMQFLELELKELTLWKSEQEQQLGDGQQYEQQLKQSHKEISDYEQQVQLLSLKLEAAELAGKQRKERVQDEGDEELSTTWERRADELKSELASVRAKYSKLLIHSAQKNDDGSDAGLNELEEQMDQAIQSAVQSSLEAVEKEWQVKFEKLRNQLANITDYAASMEEERNTALNSLEEALSTQTDYLQQQEASILSDEQQQLLKEELTQELTDKLTEQLTEQLTERFREELTKSLTEKIERKYRKKYAKLRKQQDEQQNQNEQAMAEQKQSQDEIDRKQKAMIQAEVKKIQQQYELEYETKLEQLQQKNEEEVQIQKDRMRKLVKALLEREAKQKRKLQMEQANNIHVQQGSEITKKECGTEETAEEGSEKKTITRPKKKKKKHGEGNKQENDSIGKMNVSDDSFTKVSPSMTSSRKRKPGIVPVRGNTGVSRAGG